MGPYIISYLQTGVIQGVIRQVNPLGSSKGGSKLDHFENIWKQIDSSNHRKHLDYSKFHY